MGDIRKGVANIKTLQRLARQIKNIKNKIKIKIIMILIKILEIVMLVIFYVPKSSPMNVAIWKTEKAIGMPYNVYCILPIRMCKIIPTYIHI